MVRECFMNLECRFVWEKEIVPGDDHVMLCLEVVGIHIDEDHMADRTGENGILFGSGLIAGEGLVGILLAIFAVIPVNGKNLLAVMDMGGALGNAGGVIFFAALMALYYVFANKKLKK